MNADGTNVTRLTNVAASTAFRLVARRPADGFPLGSQRRWAVYVMSATARMLTKTSTPTSAPALGLRAPLLDAMS